MKKKHLLIIATWLMLLTVSMSMLTFVGCGDGGKKVLHVDTEIVGTYYVDDGDVENTLTLEVDSFTLVFGGVTQTGEYSSYDNSSATNVKVGLKLKDGTCELAYSKGVIVLSYNGNTYRMLRKVDYTVTFDTDGGSSVAAQTVQNGRKAAKPADPQKEGHVFLGWYKDNAYAQKYDFENTTVVSSITVYARFVKLDPDAKVYTVNFNLGTIGAGLEIPAMQTINQKLYNLPEPKVEGEEFLGWWISDYGVPDKLSRKYKEQTINENTILYAVWASEYPAVSVNENGAEWSVKGNAKRFSVVIKDSDGKVLKSETGEKTSYAFDFGAVAAGDYTVEVTCNGRTTVAYYRNKPLNKVTEFTVEGNVLKFEGVEGAEKYLLTIICGNATHEHNDIDLGTTTQYDFSACEMKDGKLTFVVKAVADGHATSASDAYVLDRVLDAVTGLTVDAATETVKWNAVANAEAYAVELTSGESKIEKTLTGTQLEIGEYASGTWTVKVKAVNKLYNSPEYTTYEYTKTRLASPSQISARLNVITWNAIEGATGYLVEIDGQEYSASTNSLTVDEGVYNKGSFAVRVKALGETEAQNSLYSKLLNVLGELTEVRYANGLATWSPVIGATKYGVSVDGGAETYVENGSCELEYAFTLAGAHTLKVSAYSGDTLLDDMVIDLTLYAVNFNTSGGTKIDTLYKVKGDTVQLSEDVTRVGYNFVGWYDKAEGGSKYNAELTVGEANLTVYAAWSGKTYQVTLVVGDGGTMEGENVFTVVYGDEFQFPVANCKDVDKAFGGWFSSPTKGVSYTDNGGNGRFKWNSPSDTTLYAQWETTGLVYELNTDGESYMVKKSEGVNYLKTLEILATYNGKPVTHILSNAFAGCANLEKIRIPSSIQSIFLYAGGDENVNGPNMNGSAFYKCDSLKEIEVYDAGGERFYTSINGCLYKLKNEQLDRLEYVPKGQNVQSTFTIADGTKMIPNGVMSGMSNITEIIIPASVTYVGERAFNTCYALQTVKFLSPADGSLGEGLTVKAAFNSDRALTTLVLPKRLVEFDIKGVESELLKAITVTELGADQSVKDTTSKYYDVNGILYKGDENGNGTAVYCPRGYEGEYRVPVGVTAIGAEAFKNCVGITFIQIPGYVELIDKSAFYGCTNVQRLIFGQGERKLTINEKAFYSLDTIGEVTLPSTLVYLGKNAFGNTSRLETVIMEMTQEFVLENGAFKVATYSGDGDSYVHTLKIGANVRDFDITGVVGTDLINIEVDPDNQYFHSEENVLYNGDQSKILFVPFNIYEFTIPSSVKVIGSNMFTGRVFTSIVIGKGVEEIGEGAFENCFSLKSITFEAGGTKKITIGKNAFKNVGAVTKFNLPERAEEGSTIGEGAFSRKEGEGLQVNTIDVPEGFTEIGRFAFRGINALHTLNLPSTIKSLGVYEKGDKYSTLDTAAMTIKNAAVNIVNGCYYLENINVAEGSKYYASKDGVLYSIDPATNEWTLQIVPLYAKAGKDADGEYGYVEVPDTVKAVSDYAFYNNKNVKKVVFLGNHETFSMGNKVFVMAENVEMIQLPSGLDGLFENMFQMCYALKEITVPNTVTSIRKGTFGSCESLKKLVFAPGGDKELKISDGTSSGSGRPTWSGVFTGCNALEEVIFTDRLTSIGTYAFYKCAALRRVVIPNSVATIGDHAFDICSALTTVEFTDAGEKAAKEMTIGSSAFLKAPISSIDLPDNLVEMKLNAFGSTLIETLSIPASVKTFGSLGLNKLKSITFETKDGKSNLTTLTNRVFSGYKFLESIDLSATNLVEIPSESFENAAALTTVTLPLTINKIGASAFSGCTSLTGFNFPKDANEKSNVTNIGNQAFENTGLTRFEFPETNGTLTIGTKLFNGCENLTYVYISNSVNPDQLGAAISGAPAISTFGTAPGSTLIFDDTNKLMLAVVDPEAENKTYKIIKAYDKIPTVDGTFTIPSNVVEISPSVFTGMNYIKKIIIPASVKEIGDSAFENCFALEIVEITNAADNPSMLESIGASAFKNTISLKEITLPNSVKVIGTSAFSLSGLKKVTMPDELSLVGSTVFTNCYWLTEVNNLSKITTVNSTYKADNMFSNCTSLTTVTFAEGFDTLTRGMFCNSGLKTINLTGVKNLTTQGSGGAFENCKSLTSVTIDEGLKTLDIKMFYGCTNLKTITVNGNTAVEGFADLGNITNTTAKATSYIESALGQTAIREADISSMTKADGLHYLFYEATSLEKVVLAKGVEALGNAMFRFCSSLKTVVYADINGNVGEENCVTLPEGLSFMGYYSQRGTFEGTAIEKVIIPTTVKVLGTTATAASASSSVNLFKNCTSLTTVTLHNTLTKFSASIFEGCTNLTTVNYRDAQGNITGENNAVTLPKTITQFGQKMFYGCTSITSVTTDSKAKLDNSMFENCTSLVTANFKATQLGNLVFAGCTMLQSTEENPLPTSQLTSVGNQVFQGCTSIEYIDLSKCTALGGRTSGGSSKGFFYGCTNLKKVSLKSTLTEIPAGAFAYCSSLEEITLPTTVNFIGNYAFQYSGLRGITIPTKVTRLGSTTATGNVSMSAKAYTFSGCANLETVTLPDGFRLLGGYAFSDCPKLKEVINIDKVTFIGASAFENSGLTESGLSMDISAVENIGSNAFENSGIKEANLTSVLKSQLGTYAFRYATKLTTVTFGEGIEEIKDGAFRGCTALNNLDLTNVKTIGENAFIGCSSLDTVKFGALESIGFQAFLNCGFDTFTLPATLTTLEENVFNNRYKLAIETGNGTFRLDANGYLLNGNNEVLWIPGYDNEGNPVTEITFAEGYKLTGYILNGFASVTKVTLPSNLDTIASYAFWNFQGSFGNELILPASLTTIEDFAFENCSGLKNVTIPASVTTIGTQAFINSSVENVTFKQGATNIGFKMFENCKNLTTVTLPGSLETIGNYAFNNCTSLTEVIVSATSEDLTSGGLTIGNYAFCNTGLNGEFTVPYGVTSIGEYAFQFAKFTKVSLPSTLTTIGKYAFNSNVALTEVNIPYSVSSIGASAFSANPSLAKVTFDETPEGVAETSLIGENGSVTSGKDYDYLVEEFAARVSGVFSGDAALKTITLPSRLTTIGSYMFAYSGLESITLPDGVSVIDSGAFMGTGIISVTIPYTVTSIGNNAFALCKKLTTVNFAATPEGVEDVVLTIDAPSSSSKATQNITYNTYCEGDGKYYGGAFAGSMAIETMTLPARLKEVPEYMFTTMSVKTVVLEDGLAYLGDYAFNYATQIKELVLPASLKDYGTSPFVGWTKEQKITLRLYEVSDVNISWSFFNGNNANVKVEVVVANTL